MYATAVAGFNDDPEQRQMARISMASVRRHMPDVEIVHLSDHRTKTLEGADSVMAIEWKAGHSNRGDLHALVHGDVLFLDTDTLIARDLRPVFDGSFEVAVAKRPDAWAGPEKYNQGVVFSSDEHFWKDLAEHARARKQWSEVTFMEVFDSGRYRTKVLPEIYNYSPPADVAVLHWKGIRHRDMLRLFG